MSVFARNFRNEDFGNLMEFGDGDDLAGDGDSLVKECPRPQNTVLKNTNIFVHSFKKLLKKYNF